MIYYPGGQQQQFLQFTRRVIWGFIHTCIYTLLDFFTAWSLVTECVSWHHWKIVCEKMHKFYLQCWFFDSLITHSYSRWMVKHVLYMQQSHGSFYAISSWKVDRWKKYLHSGFWEVTANPKRVISSTNNTDLMVRCSMKQFLMLHICMWTRFWLGYPSSA